MKAKHKIHFNVLQWSRNLRVAESRNFHRGRAGPVGFNGAAT